MSTKRVNVTMPDTLWEIAQKRAEDLHFGGNVSAYLAHLIRLDSGVVSEESASRLRATEQKENAAAESKPTFHPATARRHARKN